MGFTLDEANALRDALLHAYNPNSLEQMLFFQLGKNLNQIVGPGDNQRTAVFKVIQNSQEEGWTSDLVHAAHDENPGNPKLKAFVEQYARFKGAAPTLEKIIQKSNSFLDVATWRSKLERIERQVCSIEMAGDHQGTGFLINHDLVMTNYHVVEDLLGDVPKFTPQHVRVRFDFKKSEDGTVLNDGIRYTLAENGWLVDSSPYGSAEGKNNFEALPELSELDYAVLRLAPLKKEGQEAATTPGNEPVLGFSDKTRGWLSIPEEETALSPEDALFIMQHPDGKPLKMALATDSIIGFNTNRTRLRHKTNTEAGSSGSACFSSNWNLVALHHAGDPNWFKPEWNQAVPIRAIQRQWEENGLSNKILGAAPPVDAEPEPDDAQDEFSADEEADDMLQ
ncbi:MAG: effector-associated domain EAD1-containing protein [Chloroflexota bacterium]